MNKSLIVAVVAGPLISFGETVNEYATKITTGTYSFEQSSDLNGWNAVNGSITRSAVRAKVGSSAGLWSWDKGGHLLIENPKGLKEAAEGYEGGSPEKFERKYAGPGLEGGLKLWLYNETPSADGQLLLQVGHDAAAALETPRYKIPVKLNFKGWRAVWVHFEEDAKIEGYDGPLEMHAMALVPSEGSAGALYIDWVNFVTYVSLKRHSDYQVVNSKTDEIRYDSYTILKYDEGRKLMAPAPFDAAEAQAFESIADRLEFLVMGSHNGEMTALSEAHQKMLTSFFRKGRAEFEKLNIREEDGVITGASFFSGRDEHAPVGTMNFQSVGQNILFPLVLEYRVTKNPEALDRALLLLDHLNDQGFAAGSANGSADHMIRVNSFGLAMFLIRDELAETGRLDRDAAMAVLEQEYDAYVRTRQAASHSYVGYQKPIKRMRAQVRESAGEIDLLMARQGHLLEVTAIEELIARRSHLENYGDKARFALADSYDRATQAQAKVDE